MMIIKTNGEQGCFPDSEIKSQFIKVAEQFIAYCQRQQSMRNLLECHNDSDNYNRKNSFYYQVMQVFEEKLLQMILEENQHNRSKTAEALGISRHTLRTKLEYYQLNTINPVKYGKLQR